jgi:hypothetical protein
VERDERTVAVENASYRWSYVVLCFGLLLAVIYRSLVRQEAAWDLLALVVIGGAVGTAYQGFQRVLTRQWTVTAILTMVAAAVGAFVVAWFCA